MASLEPLIRQDSLIGEKYRLGPVIGSGGIATVYRATHIWTEREVAVKVLDPTLPHFEQLRAGFLREARATVQLNHPNVVDVLDMGEDDWETAYLVMELLHGPTLRDVLLKHGKLGEEETLAILLPLLDALEKAHELGIVHRDFKPENIILTLDPYGAVTPKLLDFGTAEILQSARTRSLSSASGVIMGTPHYMSPEQARDERAQIGPHTDVWGAGVVWYECLTGRAPFDGDSPLDVLHAVCEAPIDFEALPAAYVALLRDALHRSPELRIGSLSELKARIERMGIVRASIPAAPASLSSVPAPSSEDRSGQQTLAGLGPEELRLRAAATTRVDSELISLPLRSNRKALLAGLGLAIVVAVAAWWTVRESLDQPETRAEAVTAEPDPPPTIVEPARSPVDTLPMAPEEDAQKAAAPAEAAEAAPKTDVPPLEFVAPEPERTEPKPPPPEAKRRNRPQPRRRAPTPDSSQYQRPPDLVTEW
jgi:serine/threonine-protein kinase